MRGIISAAGYVPYRRLSRVAISDFMGSGGGNGTRAVASPDQDTTTLGVEAGRLALMSSPRAFPESLWFATSSPAYLDKTNATAIATALRLAPLVPAFDFGGALRSAVGCLLAALDSTANTLVVAADMRDGLPTSVDESAGGDSGAAIMVGSGPEVIAEFVASGSVTAELTERWRTPGDRTSKLWEERFGEHRYLALGRDAVERALKSAGVPLSEVGQVIVTGMHGRATAGLAKRIGIGGTSAADDLSSSVGQSGAAHPLLVLASVLESLAEEETDQTGTLLLLVHLADGADAVLFRVTPALQGLHPQRSVRDQIQNGAPVSYSKFLAWRGQLTPEPPRRPEPARVSSSAAHRNADWKFGLVGSRDRSSGVVHMPPARISMTGGAVDDMEPVPMATTVGTVVTFTVDRLAYSPNPPIVFAIVDFDGGGRYPIELTDVDASEVKVGLRVEMTFRRLFSADGIHDYFWKARPIYEEDAP
jgi:hydroxymethylglutaryl-CoA synthase